MSEKKALTGSAEDYQPLAAASRWIVLFSYFALLLVLSIGTMWLPSCNRSPNTVIWLIYIVPLLVFLPGLLRQNTRSHVWVAFLCNGYFLVAVNTIFACPSALLGVEIALTVVLFTSAALFTRWRSRELALAQSR
ncbi:MAG: putative membrane protein [Paraglaciecola psychrophila]